jgi:hypothetical protein
MIGRRVTLTLASLLLLTACGKAGAPHIAGSSFPHNYPDPALAPSPPAHPLPEDQPGVVNAAGSAKFTRQGSYIDPSVQSTELLRNGLLPGASLPNAHTTSSDQPKTPFTSGLQGGSQSPLPPLEGTVPQTDPDAEIPEQP